MADPFSQKCPESLRRAIEADPDRSFDLILRVSVAGEDQERQIEEAGFTVRHRTRIVPAFAVTGRGAAVSSLLAYPWLIAVEPDSPVRAF